MLGLSTCIFHNTLLQNITRQIFHHCGISLSEQYVAEDCILSGSQNSPARLAAKNSLAEVGSLKQSGKGW